MRNALRETRRKAGFSQYKLAEKIGVSRSFYSQIETGAKNPSLGTMARIKLALRRTSDSLFDDDQSADKPKRGAPFKD